MREQHLFACVVLFTSSLWQDHREKGHGAVEPARSVHLYASNDSALPSDVVNCTFKLLSSMPSSSSFFLKLLSSKSSLDALLSHLKRSPQRPLAKTGVHLPAEEARYRLLVTCCVVR